MSTELRTAVLVCAANKKKNGETAEEKNKRTERKLRPKMGELMNVCKVKKVI